VDDGPFLTELYATLLERAGYTVKGFCDRAQALATLTSATDKPDLLVTDYLGSSMAVEPFMEQCRLVHPSLRILMVSGFSLADLRFSRTAPDRFIQKPFTIEQFRNEVASLISTTRRSVVPEILIRNDSGF
jgi:DNA-binding NtrC family response regulator